MPGEFEQPPHSPHNRRQCGWKTSPTRLAFAHEVVERHLVMGDLAARFEQAMGLEPITAEFLGERIPIADDTLIPPGLRGHVQVLLDLKLMAVEFMREDDKTGVRAQFHPFRKLDRFFSGTDFPMG